MSTHTRRSWMGTVGGAGLGFSLLGGSAIGEEIQPLTYEQIMSLQEEIFNHKNNPPVRTIDPRILFETYDRLQGTDNQGNRALVTAEKTVDYRINEPKIGSMHADGTMVPFTEATASDLYWGENHGFVMVYMKDYGGTGIINEVKIRRFDSTPASGAIEERDLEVFIRNFEGFSVISFDKHQLATRFPDGRYEGQALLKTDDLCDPSGAVMKPYQALYDKLLENSKPGRQ